MKAELIDRMGDDLTVVNSARVSFNKESQWYWKDTVDDPDQGGFDYLLEKDQKLIKYLAKHNHWTPFSHVQITMREIVPIFVARQRFKHQIGFTYNEVSRRYTDEDVSFYEPSVWRGRPTDGAKQGSSDQVITEYNDGHGYISTPKREYEEALGYCRIVYWDLIKSGVAPEQARMVLPQSMYTSYYVTGSLAAWARAYKLRSDEHAQKEIQELAKQWTNIIGSIPELRYSWTALTSS